MNNKIKKLNLGCGPDYKQGWTNLDFDKSVKADKYVNLNKGYWLGLKSDHYDYVLCSHILEHLEIPFPSIVSELYRISKNKAIIEIRAPFFLSTKYYADPTHKIPFSIRTFENYTIPENLKFYEKWRKNPNLTDYGIKEKFRLLKKRFIYSNYKILKWMNFICNIEPVFYERFLAGILPPEEVYFKLEVIK